MAFKVAIAGLGRIGKVHCGIVAGLDECELTAVCDILPQEEIKVDLPNGCNYYQSLEQLLANEKDLDVVSICTPNGLHTEQSIQVLNSGKHVVCEKPMGLSKADCEQVIHTALHSKKSVFVVMQNRYSPPSQWLKQVLSDGLLGEIRLVQINCLWNRDEAYYANSWKGTAALDGGTLYTQFSHFIDMMFWLLGDIKNIRARFDNHAHPSIEFEDTGIVTFDFVKGGSGCISYSTAVPLQNMESSLTIVGSNGSVKVGGQYMNEIEYCNIDGYVLPDLLPSNPPNQYGTYVGSASNHAQVYENVIQTLKGESTATTNALEGLKVVDIIERIYDQKSSR